MYVSRPTRENGFQRKQEVILCCSGVGRMRPLYTIRTPLEVIVMMLAVEIAFPPFSRLSRIGVCVNIFNSWLPVCGHCCASRERALHFLWPLVLCPCVYTIQSFSVILRVCVVKCADEMRLNERALSVCTLHI